MSEKLTEADNLCNELAETLNQNPDTVEITITIPHPFFGEYTVTGAEIAQMAADDKL
jgi:DNA-directed RNA polymerase subunit L